jgi:hypothetical protein
MKVYALEFTRSVATSIGGEKRKGYVEGDKVVVSRNDYLPLIRLGCTLIAEQDISYDDVSWATPKKAKKAKKEETPVE